MEQTIWHRIQSTVKLGDKQRVLLWGNSRMMEWEPGTKTLDTGIYEKFEVSVFLREEMVRWLPEELCDSLALTNVIDVWEQSAQRSKVTESEYLKDYCWTYKGRKDTAVLFMMTIWDTGCTADQRQYLRMGLGALTERIWRWLELCQRSRTLLGFWHDNCANAYNIETGKQKEAKGLF